MKHPLTACLLLGSFMGCKMNEVEYVLNNNQPPMTVANKEMSLQASSVTLTRAMRIKDINADMSFKALPVTRHVTVMNSDGDFFVIAGNTSNGPSRAAEIYDSTNDTYHLPGMAMITGRYAFTAHLFPNGKVIAIGGQSTSGSTAEAEIYDFSTRLWTAAAALPAARYDHASVILPNGKILLCGGVTSSSQNTCLVYDAGLNTWTSAASMNVARGSLTMTLLNSGKVLAVSSLSAEVYDPGLNTWTSTPALSYTRANHSATLLQDGSVLVAGGSTASGYSEERYNPTTGLWTLAGRLAVKRVNHRAVLMPDGRVLVAGGIGNDPSYTILSKTEIYDPSTNAWTLTGPLIHPRVYHTAHLNDNGDVMVMGGESNYYNGAIPQEVRIEVYNASTGQWSTLNQHPARFDTKAHLLPDGKVLVAAGEGAYTAAMITAEAFDPESETWSSLPSLFIPRTKHDSATLKDGRILYAGGWDTGTYGVTESNLYNPNTKSWARSNYSGTGRYHQTVTALNDGRGIMIGGIAGAALTECNLYDQNTHTWTTTGNLITGRYGHRSLLLPHSNKVLSVGGRNGATRLASTELFDPSLGTWSAGPTMAIGRYKPALTLMANGKVMISGGQDPSNLATALVDLYDPGTNTISAIAPMNVARAFHSALLLPNGKIIVTDGAATATTNRINSTEIYDPDANTWTVVSPSLSGLRFNHFGIVLNDGRILYGGETENPTAYYPNYVSTPGANDTLVYFYETAIPVPTNCSAPYTYNLIAGSGTLYASGKYVPNQYIPEVAEILVTSSDECRGIFKVTTTP